MIMRLAIGVVLVLVTACGRHQAATTMGHGASRDAQFHAETTSFNPSNRNVQRAVANARAGRAQSFVFEVSTSFGYGCTCPPFVLGVGEEFVMPTFGGLPDPESYYGLGTFRMLGHFDGRAISAIQWRHEAGKEYVWHEDDTDWDVPQPSIVVEDWCIEPNWDALEGWTPRASVVEDLRELRALGRICPGALPRDGELVAAVLAPAP
jgi:hypothetical protein